MSELVAVWDMVRARRAGPLGQYVIWKPSPRHVIWNPQSAAGPRLLNGCVIAPRDVQEAELFEYWKDNDPIEPARYLVCRIINERLAGRVNPVIAPLRDGEISLFPKTLLAALYVLFALEVSGRTRPAILCAGCDRYFIPTHGATKYCDDACRKASWDRKNRTPRRASSR